MKTRIETEINAPAAQVWQVLAHEFAQIDRWASIVETSRPIDQSEVPAGYSVAADAPIPGRQTTSKIGTFTEVFRMFSDEKREFIFRAAGLPPFIALAENHSRVIDRGPDQSTLTFEILMEPKGIFKLMNRLLRRRFGSSYGRLQQELKQFVENGISTN